MLAKTSVTHAGWFPSRVEKEKWHILPVGEVHDQPAALAGGQRRNTPWARVSGTWRGLRKIAALHRPGTQDQTRSGRRSRCSSAPLKVFRASRSDTAHGAILRGTQRSPCYVVEEN
jgi:hypothetical protein